ncbi:MAG: hypothetical protein U0900_20505 [Myxococcota bacterium]
MRSAVAGRPRAGRAALALAGWLGGLALLATTPLRAETGDAEAGAHAGEASASRGTADPAHPCADGATLATGRPDPALFAYEASRGVQAYWCETYDAQGTSRRAGPYWDLHPNGATRVRAAYADSRLAGAVEVFDEDGTLWLRGELVDGAWNGPLQLFHANGGRWLTAHFRAGPLDGPVETGVPDGQLESQTRFEGGHEEGIATSFHPAAAGGGLRSQVRVEADRIVDRGPTSQPAEPTPADAMPDPLPMARRDTARP